MSISTGGWYPLWWLFPSKQEMRSQKDTCGDVLTSPYDVITFLSLFPPPLQLPSKVSPSSATRHSPRAQPHRVRADHLSRCLSSQWLLRWLRHCQGLRRRSPLIQALPQRSGAGEKDRSPRLTALSSSSFKTLNRVTYRYNYILCMSLCVIL